ncbi:MAG: hypothetical protein AAF411_22105 [Myxococcota bacterium]
MGALIVGACTVALAVGGGGSLRWLVVALGAVFSLGWFAASRRPPDGTDRLQWNDRGIEFSIKGRVTHLRWETIDEIEADEERLVVRVRTDEREAKIPLGWQGIGLHELAEALQTAHARSKENAAEG